MHIVNSRFHEVLFEESLEGLDVMERELSAIQTEEVDAETINILFRAAHSIKSGAATFGYRQVANFTHDLESLLDRIRHGSQPLDIDTVKTLLQAIKTLRDMLASVEQSGMAVGKAAVMERQQQQTQLHIDNQVSDKPEKTDADAAPDTGWQISFKPHSHLLQTGHNLTGLLRELAELGTFSVKLDTTALPRLENLDPEQCYLAWKIELRGSATLKQISDVFEWIEGDCDLRISSLSANDVKEVDSDMVLTGESIQYSTDNTSSLSDMPLSFGASMYLDSLMQGIEMLVRLQSRLERRVADFDTSQLSLMQKDIGQLKRYIHDLQQNLIKTCLMPLKLAFEQVAHLVEQQRTEAGKRMSLAFRGEYLELDKNLGEKIVSPLFYLVCNAIEQGLEGLEERGTAGKTETGLIQLYARFQQDGLLIEVLDDGAGREQSKRHTSAVSEVSGRRTGLDAVRKSIRSLGGDVTVSSREGIGTCFTISLPRTSVWIDGQILRVGDQFCVIPWSSIVTAIEIRPGTGLEKTDHGEMYDLHGENVPVFRLAEIFKSATRGELDKRAVLIVLETKACRLAVLVDEVLTRQRMLIKPLEIDSHKVAGGVGVCVLEDETEALVLDMPNLLSLYHDESVISPFCITEAAQDKYEGI